MIFLMQEIMFTVVKVLASVYNSCSPKENNPKGNQICPLPYRNLSSQQENNLDTIWDEALPVKHYTVRSLQWSLGLANNETVGEISLPCLMFIKIRHPCLC